MKRNLKSFAKKALTSAGMLLLMLSPSAFGAPAYWNGPHTASTDYSVEANWNLPPDGAADGVVPWDPTCTVIIINPGAYPCVIDNAIQPETPATSLIISVGARLTITTNGTLYLPGSFSTASYGDSAPVSITGGSLFITNLLSLGTTAYRGDFNISAGTVTAGALSINNTAGTKMRISGSGAFITDIGQLGNVEYWLTHGDIAGKDLGWTLVVDTNTIAGKIKITATGADFYTVTATSQNATFDPIDTANDALLGLLPAGCTSSSTFGWDAAFGVAGNLTDGQIQGWGYSPLISSGTVLTFALANRSDLTNFATYSYWSDGGRVNQDYTLSVSTNGGASFNTLQTISAVPSVGGSHIYLKVELSIAGSIKNVTHVRFSFPSTQNGGVGYQELVVQGTNSPALPDVAPGFATDLPPAAQAGRQLPFALSVVPTGNPVPTCQWYKNNDPILGATLPILNFPRFAPSDVGTYFVTVTNSQGSTNSVSCVVTMTNQPSVLAFWDPYSQNGSFDPLNLENDLILNSIPLGWTIGQSETEYGVATPIEWATDGQFGPGNPWPSGNFFWFQSATDYTWALPSPSDITNVATYSGWPDSGRVNQDYILSVSHDGGVTFKDIVTVDAIPSISGSPLDLQVLISPNVPLTNVTHVRFHFGTPLTGGNVQNLGVGYTELVVQGTPSPVRPVITVTRSGTDLILTWAGGGLLQSAPNVVGTYTDIIGSSSPWTNAPAGVQEYYRVRQ
jgi:hypothetical protein